VEFLKAHGTGNDFVVLPDLAGELELGAGLVAALCDRRFGIGADGVLRVVRTDACAESVPDSEGCTYFMDYRNADGSVAQMCGNGARVFAQYLWDAGWAPAGAVRFATRGGARLATLRNDGQVRVEMGLAQIGPTAMVNVPAAGRDWPATAVHVPNPHAVVFVSQLAEAGSLLAAPIVTPAEAFPEGANVEFVVVRAAGQLAMRVHERGVGETLSCGTGACAAAVAYLAGGTSDSAAVVQVDVPGGTLSVEVHSDLTVSLTGPVVTVAAGRIAADWLEARR